MRKSRWIGLFLALITIGGVSLTAVTSASAAARATRAHAFVGKPIDLMVINNQGADRSNPETYGGAIAAASAIDAAGGIHGHKLVILTCNDDLSPNATAACGRSAASNPNVMALAGTYSEFGDNLDPIVHAAGLANIGMFSISGSDYASGNVFPVSSGAIGSVAGMATLVTDVLHSKRVSVAYVDVASGAAIVGLLEGVLASRPGAKIVDQVPIPDSATDLSASVEAATKNNPGGIILVLSANTDLQFLVTAHSQGVKIPIVSPGAEVSEAAIAKLGQAADGTYITTAFRPSGGAGNATFTAQMNKYAKGDQQDDLAKNSWLSVWLFDHVANSLHTVTRAGILHSMPKVVNYSTGGMTPNISFNKPFTGFGGSLPRLFNLTVVYNKITNSKFRAVGPMFANPFAPVSG